MIRFRVRNWDMGHMARVRDERGKIYYTVVVLKNQILLMYFTSTCNTRPTFAFEYLHQTSDQLTIASLRKYITTRPCNAQKECMKQIEKLKNIYCKLLR